MRETGIYDETIAKNRKIFSLKKLFFRENLDNTPLQTPQTPLHREKDNLDTNIMITLFLNEQRMPSSHRTLSSKALS